MVRSGVCGIVPSNATANALKSNSDDNARQFAAGLAPVLKLPAGGRDVLTRARRTNLAPGAKVTASATLDPRFAPEHAADNQTAEYPADGHFDYTFGIAWSSGRFAG